LPRNLGYRLLPYDPYGEPFEGQTFLVKGNEDIGIGQIITQINRPAQAVLFY